MMEVKTAAGRGDGRAEGAAGQHHQAQRHRGVRHRLRRGPAPPHPGQHPPGHAGHRWPARSATACAAAAPTRPWSPRTASTWASPAGSSRPAFKSTAAFEIQTAGYGADNPTAPGGMLNLVTRSGSNKFEFEFNATADADQLRFFRDSRRHPGRHLLLRRSTRPSPGRSSRTSSGTSSTPRPTSPRTAGSATSRAIFPDPVPTQRIIPKGNVKLTWQATTPQQAVAHQQLRAALRAQPRRRRGHRCPTAQEDRRHAAHLPGGDLGVGAARRPDLPQPAWAASTSPSTSTPRCCRDGSRHLRPHPVGDADLPAHPALGQQQQPHPHRPLQPAVHQPAGILHAQQGAGRAQPPDQEPLLHGEGRAQAVPPRRQADELQRRRRTWPQTDLLLERSPLRGAGASAGSSARTPPPRTSSPCRTPGGPPAT